jgi:hypothetical protein
LILGPVNALVLALLAPLLLLVGMLGFIIAPSKQLTSAAPAYHMFHILFGLLGVAVVVSGHPTATKAFNAGFGLIDVYQAVASYLHLFPKRYFKWTPVDDVLHLVIGLFLLLVGVLGR